jgi:hypothetical protein
MKKDAVLKLNKILQETTGVSLLQSEREEIKLRMQALVRFPTYAYRTIFFPVVFLLAFLVASTIGLCLLNYYGFAIVFLVLGSVLAILSGSLLGILLFIDRLKGEVKAIYDLVLLQVKMVLMEISIADEDDLETYWEIPPIEDVIRGMHQIVCMSFMEKEIYRRFAYFPSIIYHVIDVVFDAILDEISHAVHQLSEQKTAQPHAVGEVNMHLYYSKQGLRQIEKLMSNRNTIVKQGIRRISLSIKVITFFTCGFLGLLIGIIYLLMV